MAELVRISINLSTGTVEVHAPVDALDAIFARLEGFLPHVSAAYAVPSNPAEEAEGGEFGDVENEILKPDVPSSPSSKPSGNNRKKKAPGKREQYSVVDMGLSDADKQRFREFYAEKSPRNQNDQTLVIMYWLKTMGKVPITGWNEVFTGFRMIQGIKAPGKISSVLGNMVGQGLVVNDGKGQYKITHVGEDRVKLELPVK